MATTYKQKLHDEINTIPDNLLPRFYRIINTLRTELTQKIMIEPVRGSLRGIWSGATIDDDLISEAKKSLFSYEYKDGKR